MTTRRSVTLAITLQVPYEPAFRYLSDPRNQVEWGVLATTPMAEAPLSVLAAEENGVLDFKFGEAPTIPTRLVRNVDGIFTHIQPSGMPDAAWENQAVPNLREELALLKGRLESPRGDQ